MTTTNVAGIARAAMLVELNVSLYSGRKKDKTTQAEVVASKGAHSKQAASVYKNLFSDCKELDEITKFQARARADHYRVTLPWSDSGLRLLPTIKLLDYQDLMGKHQSEFNRLVTAFLDRYDTLVAAAAFQLGTLFNRAEYPTRDQVARKFSFDVVFTPLPTAGDFRLDIESEVQDDLVRQYEARMQTMVEQANQDAWTRLYDVLSAMSDRLAIEETEDGPKKRVFRDSLVSNADEICGLLTALNVTGDPALERARARLEDAIHGVTADDLRKSDGQRVITKQKVDAILSDFDWFQEESLDV
jgi:hypothetical protein